MKIEIGPNDVVLRACTKCGGRPETKAAACGTGIYCTGDCGRELNKDGTGRGEPDAEEMRCPKCRIPVSCLVNGEHCLDCEREAWMAP